ncbi:vWA domain-containing protein [Desulfosarcina alkanivorans]|nr:vWA domain-containing protein [Desulfosarcina alkanivorans]
MVENDNRSILLDVEEIRGEYPVSSDVFDILVGKVAFESLATSEWRDWVIDKTMAQAFCKEQLVTKYMTSIVVAAEDIYLHQLFRSSIWSLYLSRYWRSMLERNSRDPNLPPSPTSLANAWRFEAIFGIRTKRMHHYYHHPLKILRQHTDGLRAVVNLSALSQRRIRRSELYAKIWRQLAEAFAEWETFQDFPDAVEFFDESALQGDSCEEADQQDDDSKQAEQSACKRDDDFMDRIKEAVDHHQPSDLTRAIALAIEDPEAAEMETVIKHGLSISDVQPDTVQMLRFQNLFSTHRHQLRGLQKKITRKRLAEGKIDARRLHHALLDGRIFKKKERADFDGSWHICIVADASASMGKKTNGGRPWQIAEKTFASLISAGLKFENRIDIYAYCEDGGVCVMTRLFYDNTLYTAIPKGRTPSGQAIVAAAMSLDSRYRNRMLVHISDGAANCGINMGLAIDYCRSTDVDLFAIGCGCNIQTKDFLQGYFASGQLCFIDDIVSLPTAIEGQLRLRMLSKRSFLAS